MTQGRAAATTRPHADADRQPTEPLSHDPHIAAELLVAHHGGRPEHWRSYAPRPTISTLAPVHERRSSSATPQAPTATGNCRLRGKAPDSWAHSATNHRTRAVRIAEPHPTLGRYLEAAVTTERTAPTGQNDQRTRGRESPDLVA
jgi:hypothetical protein